MKTLRSFFKYIVYLSIIIAALSGCKSNKTYNEVDIFEGELPLDLKGRTINIYDINYKNTVNNYSDDIKYIEKKFNCKINLDNPYGNNYPKGVIEDINAGTFKADAFVVYNNQGFIDLISSKIIVPIDEYIDFNNEYFNNPAQKIAYWNGRYYGVISPTSKRSIGLMWYNKSLLEREGLTDPYELQQDGQWTWENFLEISKKATKDINGDGITDQWGIIPQYSNEFFLSMLYTNNARIAGFDENNRYTCTLNSHEAEETFNFVNSLYNDYKVVLYERAEGQTLETVRDAFKQGKGAFYTSTLVFNRNDVKLSDEFANLVYPKGPSANDYIYVVDRNNYYAVPRTAISVEESAVVLKHLIAGQTSYDQGMQLAREKSESYYNTVKLASEKIYYTDVDFYTVPSTQEMLSYIISQIIKNNTSFNFRDYIEQKYSNIQSALDTMWNNKVK